MKHPSQPVYQTKTFMGIKEYDPRICEDKADKALLTQVS